MGVQVVEHAMVLARLGGESKARMRVLEDPAGLFELKDSYTVGILAQILYFKLL